MIKDKVAAMKTSLDSYKTSTSPDALNPSQKKKGDPSSKNPRLTPSEIESLRKHKQQISTYARGKFKHLFEK